MTTSKTDPAHTDPTHTDATYADPIRTDATYSDPIRTHATYADPIRTDAAVRRTPPDRRFGAVASVVGGIGLLAGFLVGPGPDVADVHRSTWVPGHLLVAAGFLLLAIGLPAIASSLGSRLGVAGWIGYTAIMTRYVLSTGSHVYSAWIMPTLAAHADLHRPLTGDGKLASVYAGHGDLIDAVLAVGMLGFVYALARCGRGLRTAAGLVGLAAVFEFISFPVGLMLLAVTGIWLGARLLRSGDVRVPIRSGR